MTESLVAKVDKDFTKLYRTNGTHAISIYCGGQVASAVVVGDDVNVTLKDGKVKIYGVNGLHKRTI